MFWIMALAMSVMADDGQVELERDFISPPASARPWCYWWWLNGCVTRDGIVRDLDHMKAKGIGGALVFHAGEGETPFQIEFMSPQWRELFKYAIKEASQRGIVIGLNLCAGWNAGGPWVKPEEAAQTLGFRLVETRGGKTVTLTIPATKPAKIVDVAGHIRREAGVTNRVPTAQNVEYYRDIAVLAWQITRSEKAKPLVCRKDTFVDLTALMQGSQLGWDAPTGNWVIVRFGHYVGSRAHIKCTGGGVYLEIDPLRADAMDRHFKATVGVVIEDVKDHVGKTFQYVHIDSGEIGKPNWTPDFRKEFKKRRGYDPFPYLAARAGIIVDAPAITERFNEDYERTLGDLMVENYYGRLAELARCHGLGTHSEAAGFQKPCVDALRSLGVNDICMSEFWSRRSETGDNYIHQLTEEQVRNHDGIKTAAAAAHTYGRRIVQAEAFTVIHSKETYPNWDRDLFAVKDIGDRAFCAGLNRVVMHGFVHQPEEESKPGYKWPGVGCEFDRHVTWAPFCGSWLTYLARCQCLLQAGRFAADACYFQGEWVPNFIPARWAMNPALPAGFDCDAINAEVLTDRARVDADGRLTLAGGMRYRYLVLNQGGRWRTLPSMMKWLGLPQEKEFERSDRLAISPATLAKIKKLVQHGMTLVGPPPARAIGLTDYPRSDAEVARMACTLWGANPPAAGEHKVGKGRVIWGKSLTETFRADGRVPDLAIMEDAASKALPPETLSGIPSPYGSFDWIHRTIGDTEVYFVANLRNAATAGEFTFRVTNKKAELWNPVTGEIRALPKSRQDRGGMTVPMRFAPRQSFFVVFQKRQTPKASRATEYFPETVDVLELAGPWEVSFDPKWGGPAYVTFDNLDDWSKRPEPGIRYYSGKATYRKVFDYLSLATRHSSLFLDLGTVKNIASVRLNGRDLGVAWCAPWRVNVTTAIKPKDNVLEIAVINLWPNRLIGDAALPPEKHFTKSNVTGFKPDMPLLPSGLLGPVILQTMETPPAN